MSNRIKKVNKLLLHEISQLVHKELGKHFITITGVETSKDLKQAKVWLSSIVDNYDEVIGELKQKEHYFKKILSKKLDLRYIPNLHFFPDRSSKLARRIDEILLKEKNSKKVKGG